MKTKRKMNLKYWGEIHEMVEAYNKKYEYEVPEKRADVKPWECVKCPPTGEAYHFDPMFDADPASYEFAVAILYDEQAGVHRPVFPEDRLYHKVCKGIEYIAKEDGLQVVGCGSLLKVWGNGMHKNLTWHKPQPKRTFIVGNHYLTNRGDVVTLKTPIEVDGMYNRFDYVFYDAPPLLTDVNGITGYGEKIDQEITTSDVERLRPKAKRTFEINGVELPCPTSSGSSRHTTRSVLLNEFVFNFRNEQDAIDVGNAIYKLLSEARDK